MDDRSSPTPQLDLEDIEDPEVDASIKPDEPLETTELPTLPDQNEAPDTMNFDGANDMPDQNRQTNGLAGPSPGGRAGADIVPEPEPRIPTKKDATLREFLGKMDDYAPIVRLPLLTASND